MFGSFIIPGMPQVSVAFPKDLLVLDLETTGTDPVVHSTIEIGAVLLDRRTLEEKKAWSTVIKRQENNGTNPRSMALHGKSLSDIRKAGKDARQAVEEFLGYFGTDYLLAGWNIGFDVQFFRALLRHTGHTEAFEAIDYHRLDVWSLAQFLKSIGLFESDVSSLSCLCEQLGLPRSKAHSGLEDARITATALRRLLERLPVSCQAVGV
jgi:DNA polymerase III epsilon subunit-like protein